MPLPPVRKGKKRRDVQITSETNIQQSNWKQPRLLYLISIILDPPSKMRFLLDAARQKLMKECCLPTPNLRQLVGHANLVDELIDCIQYASVQPCCPQPFPSMSPTNITTTHRPKTSQQPLLATTGHNCYRPDLKTGAFDTVEELPRVEFEILNGYSY